MKRTTGAKQGIGLTNAEAASLHGIAPILPDGFVATLHHSRQRGIGPLFEASTRYHNITNISKSPSIHTVVSHTRSIRGGRGKGSLREQFQKVDSPSEYWKWRGAQQLGGVE